MMDDFNPLGGMGYWEMSGQVVGGWLGATIWLASSPVMLGDGPAPGPADAAWYYANLRNTNALRKKGGMIGAGVDDLLADDEAPAGESWSTSSSDTPVETPQVAYEFDNVPGVKMPTFDSFLNFSENNFLPSDFNMDNYNFPQVDITPVVTLLNLAKEAKAQWPQWNS